MVSCSVDHLRARVKGEGERDFDTHKTVKSNEFFSIYQS